MTTIRVTCGHCDKGLVITHEDVALRNHNGRWAYTFTCTNCYVGNEKPAELPTVGKLRSVGVPIPAPTNDDNLIIRFAAQLATVDIVAELERLRRT